MGRRETSRAAVAYRAFPPLHAGGKRVACLAMSLLRAICVPE